MSSSTNTAGTPQLTEPSLVQQHGLEQLRQLQRTYEPHEDLFTVESNEDFLNTAQLNAALEKLDRQYFFFNGVVCSWDLATGNLIRWYRKDRWYTHVAPIQVQVRKGKDATKWIEASRIWERSKGRREVSSIEFLPGQTTDAKTMNLWTGWGTQPSTASTSAEIEPYLTFHRDIICNGDDTIHEWFLDYKAHLLQKPFESTSIIVALQSDKEGTGKGTDMDFLSDLVGHRHFVIAQQKAQVTSQYNPHLEHAVVVFADEAFFAGDNQAHRTIKSLSGNKFITIEHKFGDQYQARRYFRLIMASNDKVMAKIGKHDRRFAIWALSEARVGDNVYWRELRKKWDGGMRGAVMNFLMKRNISEYDPHARPMTKLNMRHRVDSLDNAERFMYDFLYGGSIPGARIRKQPHVGIGMIYEDLPDRVRRNVSLNQLYDIFEPYLAGGKPKRKMIDDRYVKVQPLRSLKECREKFVAQFGHAEDFEWPHSDDDWLVTDDHDTGDDDDAPPKY